MKDRIYHTIFTLWMVFGMRFLGYRFVSVYVPKRDEEGDGDIIGITFSVNEEYMNKIHEVE